MVIIKPLTKNGKQNGHEKAVTKKQGFASYSACLDIGTERAPDFVDITDKVHDFVKMTQVQNGLVVVFSQHTTAAIRVNENEPLLVEDMKRRLEAFAPRDAYYKHNDFTIRTVNMEKDEPPNGHAHCQNLLLGVS